jgi:hypothetical protein
MGRLREERDDAKRKGRWERLWFVGQRSVRERRRVSGAGFCGRMVREKTGIGGLLDLQRGRLVRVAGSCGGVLLLAGSLLAEGKGEWEEMAEPAERREKK